MDRQALLIVITSAPLLPFVGGCDGDEPPTTYVVTSASTRASSANASASAHASSGSGSGSGPGCLTLAAIPVASSSASKPFVRWPLPPPAVPTPQAPGPARKVAATAPPVVHLPPEAAPTSLALARPRCDPPYYYDATGSRVFKQDCL